MMSIAALGVAMHPIVVHETGEPLDAAHHQLLHLCAMAVFFWLAMIDLFARTPMRLAASPQGSPGWPQWCCSACCWLATGGLSAMVAVGLAVSACLLPVLWKP